MNKVLTAEDFFTFKEYTDGSVNYEDIIYKMRAFADYQATEAMILVNAGAQRVARRLNLDDFGKDLLHENMDMAFEEWKRKFLNAPESAAMESYKNQSSVSDEEDLEPSKEQDSKPQ